jgi:TrmH family RNA methyltransferase
MEITSLQNPRVKAAVRLRDRRDREATGLTIVDGARELGRAIDAGVEIVEAFVCDELVRTVDAQADVRALVGSPTVVWQVPPPILEKVAFGERAEGIVAIVRVPDLALGALRLPRAPLLAVVEGVEKPGNLGAILRSADGAGLDAVIAADPRTDLFNPNAIRASLGTIFAMPCASGSTAEVVAWLRDRGIRALAARVEATRIYTEADLTGPVAIVFGSEAGGLTSAWAVPEVEPVRLPMLGVSDSLNVSVAAAVLFYEARRQRGLPSRS